MKIKEKSKCCNAQIDVQGGGYFEKDVCPIEDVCLQCGQVLRINGREQEIFDPKTRKKIKP